MPGLDNNRYKFRMDTHGLKAADSKPFIADDFLEQGNPDYDGLNTKFIGNPGSGSDYAFKTSALGTPIYDNVVFPDFKYQVTDPQDSSKTIEMSVPRIEIDNAIVVVDQKKNIVKTNLSGRDGTVKEYISLDDYEISITGILTSSLGQKYFPDDLYQAFHKLCLAPVSFTIICNYINLLGITEVVIESFNFTQKEGSTNFNVPFSLKLISDRAIELELIKR